MVPEKTVVGHLCRALLTESEHSIDGARAGDALGFVLDIKLMSTRKREPSHRSPYLEAL